MIQQLDIDFDAPPRGRARGRKYTRVHETRPSKACNTQLLPQQWAERPLSTIARINARKLSDTTDPDFELQYIDIGNVDMVDGITSTERYRFEDAPSRARRQVAHGDTIISTVRTYLKAVARIIDPPENLIASTGFAVLSPKADCDPGFLYRLVQSEPFVQKVVAHSVGVSYPAINAPELGKFIVPVPPKEEQRQIADFLDRETGHIDRLIAEKKRLIELLAEKRAAVITHAVTKGLDTNARMKPSGIHWLGDVPTHWTHHKFGYITTMRGGCTPSKAEPAFWNGDIPWVSPKDMKRDIIDDSEEHVTQLALEESGLELLKPPVVLMVVRGMILAHSFPVAIAAVPVTVNQDMKALKPTDVVSFDYLHLVLRGIKSAIRALVEESGHGTRVLRTELWKKFEVYLPPREEQDRIVRDTAIKCHALDGLVETIEAVINKLTEYRSALITAAVTGRIDVRGKRS